MKNIVLQRPVNDALKAVNLAMEEFLRLPKKLKAGSERDKGGFLTLMTRATGVILTTTIVGEIDNANLAKKFHDYSLEKARRLYLRPENISSWQSRSPRLHRYGGAIAIADCILSFSGINDDLWDEALMVFGAKRLHWGRYEEQMHILRVSNNHHFDIIEEAYQRS